MWNTLTCINEPTVVEPSFKLLRPKPAEELYQSIEEAASVGWRSEGDPEKRADFIRSLIWQCPAIAFEHEAVSALIVCDQGVMAELLTLNRLASFSIESARHYPHDNQDGVMVIRPCFSTSEEATHWAAAMFKATISYLQLLEDGSPPEMARSVLPMSLATTIKMTANIFEWRHILWLGTSHMVHSQMRELMTEGLAKFHSHYPLLFGDIWDERNAA